ncbi:hypothetical protein N0V88_007234 [Collariella sp. IMI 366227]|nr:hypothetical protein N0V88_007234 [Collariella sp. IMI 366227]
MIFELDSFDTGEHAAVHDVYQRCVLLSGKCKTDEAQNNNDSYVVIKTNDNAGHPLCPEQRWPMCGGDFKALVLLSPGLNNIVISSDQHGSSCRTEVPPALVSTTIRYLLTLFQLSLRYTPLLQTPPLHLAILIASDSPLLIDCPSSKYGAFSTAHSSLSAAIAKFRMTAYMWQALTAEDLHLKGLGRRSFRLEEEWAPDTLLQSSHHNPGQNQTISSVPKVHLIRTPKTLADLRSANLSQQNPSAESPDLLHSIFTTALLAHGAPFTSTSHPIVAGLILDSHYDPSTNFILAHAALGIHQPNGLSLGMFGSHLTYAWPRFLEEVAPCLVDETPPGDTVGNDNGELLFLPVDGKESVANNGVMVAEPPTALRYSRAELKKRFGVRKPVGLEVTAMNGKQYKVNNIWSLFNNSSSITVPGTDICLLKRCIGDFPNEHERRDVWEWAVMLKKRDKTGNLVDAYKIDLRVGCGLDGAVVYYKDGEKIPCGPRGPEGGNDPRMGGHQSKKLGLPDGVEISKVAVNRGHGGGLVGLRMRLSNGEALGALNSYNGTSLETLVPPPGHKIIGFYGLSRNWGAWMCQCFGIVTAPRDVALPDSVYDMEELQNKPRQDGHSNKRRRIGEVEKEELEPEDGEMSDGCAGTPEDLEDEDGDYDD